MFCSLATRFYDSVNGHIDSKGKEAKDLAPRTAQGQSSWLSNQRKRQEQRRPSVTGGGNSQPIALQSQSLPVSRLKPLKASSAAAGPRIPPPKLQTGSLQQQQQPQPPTGSRKAGKAPPAVVMVTKKPEPRDYEESPEEEPEYENTSPAITNQ